MPVDPAHLLVVVALAVAVAGAALAVVRGRALERLRTREVRRNGGRRADRAQLDAGEALRMADWLAIGLLRLDSADRIVLANEAAHGFLGRRPGNLTGLSTIEAFVDHRIEELVGEARSNGSARRELAIGGEPPRTVAVHVRRVAGDGGVWIILEDVSELRRLQRIRAEFVDNLSHELRTPLTTVRLLIEVLAAEQERLELPPRVRDAIEKIDVETGHLAQMVNELLDLARIEGGEATMQPTDVDLGRVVEATIGRLKLYAERHGVALRSQLPDADAERIVRGDEDRLSQVLVNLVHNAIKFSPSGGEVVISLRAEPTETVLQVDDQGVGIPASELDRVFERFYKVDRARHRAGGGTGLGLAIVRHVVERHGGRISATSTEGAGSRFVVRLPRQTAHSGRLSNDVDEDSDGQTEDRHVADGNRRNAQPLARSTPEGGADDRQQDLPRE